jgi:hypothetical protein
MKKIMTSILIVAVWLAACGSLFSGDHPTVPTKHPLSHDAMIIAVGGAPMWACFGVGLAFGAALATMNGFAAFTAAIYLATNCT